MRIAAPSSSPTVAYAAPKASPAEASPEAPKDAVVVSSGSDFAQMTRMAVTGMSTLALAIPVSYAGLTGGAIVGAGIGGALGPVLGAFDGNGLLGAVGAAWHGAGTFGHAGMVLGGASALIGSYAAGKGLGNLAGRALGMPKEPNGDKRINWANVANVATGTALLTTGLAGGTVGGLVLAGGASAASTIISNAVEHGFNSAIVAGVGHNAVVFGTMGAVIAGTVSTLGAAKLTKMVARNVIDPTTEKGLPMLKGILGAHSPAGFSSNLAKQGLAAAQSTSSPAEARKIAAQYIQHVIDEPGCPSAEQAVATVSLNACEKFVTDQRLGAQANMTVLQALASGIHGSDERALADLGYTLTDGILKQAPSYNMARNVGSEFLNAIAERATDNDRKQFAITNRAAAGQMSNHHEAGLLLKKALGQLR